MADNTMLLSLEAEEWFWLFGIICFIKFLYIIKVLFLYPQILRKTPIPISQILRKTFLPYPKYCGFLF